MASVHLVLIHGMRGNPDHLAELNHITGETYPASNPDGVGLEILLAETNREDSTYDGIDWGGERVTQEVQEFEEDGKKVSRFSVTGYSLGGLVARYVVGVLHQRNFFENVIPVNFNTIATPQIGLPRYPSLISSLFSSSGPKLLSRTEVMVDPDRIFYQALALFEHIRIYANAINDTTVPRDTASIETEDPFTVYEYKEIEVDLHETFAPLIKTHWIQFVSPPRTPKALILSPTWFRNRSEKPSWPLLPPSLQVRFPFNIALYVLSPIIIPVAISLIIVRFSLATRSSRVRIRLLEKDETNRQRLIHILAQLEKDVENIVVELIDDDDPRSAPPAETSVCQRKSKKVESASEQPILTLIQRKIAGSLKKLPIKKEVSYIENMRNSHAIIVCRDVKRFKVHRNGEGVLLRHWAVSFI